MTFNTNPFASASPDVGKRTSLRYDMVIDSHNFGKITGDVPGEIAKSIESFSFQKTITGPGQLSLTLLPDFEWLDLVSPNDYINFYVNISTGEEDVVYNRGWVRLFFGFVDDIRRVERVVSPQGAVMVRYSLTATDVYKVLSSTTIFNHPAIPATEIFGANMAGVASSLYRLGLIVRGSSRFLLMHNLYVLLGYGSQWALPAHYNDNVKNATNSFISYRKENVVKRFRKGVESHFAKTRKRNDILRDIQEKRDGILAQLAFRSTVVQAEIATDRTKFLDNITSYDFYDPITLRTTAGAAGAAKLLDSLSAEESKAVVVATQAKAIKSASVPWKLASDAAKKAGLKRKKSYAQLTPDITAPHQEVRSLLDIISFDNMENVEGFYGSTDLWHFQGPIINMINTLSNPVINEFYYDLRPTMDTLMGGQDGIGHELDGGMAMVPSFVLRERPFNYHPAGDQSLTSKRLIDINEIRKEAFDFAAKPIDKVAAPTIGQWGEPPSWLNTESKSKDFTDTFSKVLFVDTCGAIWLQQERTVDYGDVLGFNFDAFWEDAPDEDLVSSHKVRDATRYRDVVKYNRGPRTLDHVEISNSDVISQNLGRGDQDIVTGYDCVPMTKTQQSDFRSYVRDYTPQFRMLLIRRHGLRFVPHESYFITSFNPHEFAFSDRYQASVFGEGLVTETVQDGQTYAFNKKYIEFPVPGVPGSIPAENIFSSVEWYMNIKITILRDMWDQHNSEYLNGSIDLRDFPGIRVGFRLDWPDQDLSFYVVGVKQSGAFAKSNLKTSVTVTKGQPLSKPLEYHIPDNRKKQEYSQGFKLGMPFSVADPSDGVSVVNGSREKYPGEPSERSPVSIHQNYGRVRIKIGSPTGINEDIGRRGSQETNEDQAEAITIARAEIRKR